MVRCLLLLNCAPAERKRTHECTRNTACWFNKRTLSVNVGGANHYSNYALLYFPIIENTTTTVIKLYYIQLPDIISYIFLIKLICDYTSYDFLIRSMTSLLWLPVILLLPAWQSAQQGALWLTQKASSCWTLWCPAPAGCQCCSCVVWVC